MVLWAHITPLEVVVVAAVYLFGAVTGWLVARGQNRSHPEQPPRKNG